MRESQLEPFVQLGIEWILLPSSTGWLNCFSQGWQGRPHMTIVKRLAGPFDVRPLPRGVGRPNGMKQGWRSIHMAWGVLFSRGATRCKSWPIEICE